MAALALTGQLYVDGAWTTYPGYSQEGWETQVGPNPESGLQPNQLAFTFASDNDEMDPTNPASALYGKIGRNTPCRLQIGGTTLTHAEVSSWDPNDTPEHVPGVRGRSWVNVTGDGLLRRLGRWTDPIASPMVRQTLSSTTLIGFWPGEDAAGAANLFQAAPGVAAPNATLAGTVTLADDDGAGGSDKLLTLGADGRISGTFAASTGNGYQISWTAKMAAQPTTATYLDVATWRDGDGRYWQWMANWTNFRILVTSGAGATLYDASTPYTGREPNNYLRYRMKVTVSAGTITIEPAWYVQDDPSPAGFTDTFAGTTARRPRQWTIAGNAWMAGAAVGHVFATTDTAANLLTGSARDSFNGYLGEITSWRFYRLLTEQGLTATYIGTFGLGKPMGRQKPGLFLDLVEEAVRADGGLLYDWPGGIGLVFRMLNSIIGQTPAMALAKTDLAPGLRKKIDDVGAANDITGENWDGTKYRTEQTTGPLSTAVPPAGVGRYKGGLDLSLLAYDDLVQRVEFQRARNTVARSRYPTVTLDLLARPDLRAAVTALRPGDLITLSGVEAELVPLLVMTIKRKGGAVEDTATLDCVPADSFLGARYDAAAYRYDLRTSTVAAASASATTLTFTQTDDETWSSTSAYDLLISGERVGIPIGGMGARTGTGPWQQIATGVTRAKNGISKALPSGAEAHIATPGRWAL